MCENKGLFHIRTVINRFIPLADTCAGVMIWADLSEALCASDDTIQPPRGNRAVTPVHGAAPAVFIQAAPPISPAFVSSEEWYEQH